MNRSIRMTLAALGAWLVVTAQAGATPLAFVHATVHTATGPALEDATLVVDGGRILSVTAGGSPPAGAQIVECTGKHVWPGIVDPWSRLGLVEISSVRGTRDDAETGSINPNVRAEVMINPDSELLPVTRYNGITSALVVPTLGDDRPAGGGGLPGSSALIHLDGWTREDMTIKAPVALHVEWPAMGISRSRFETRSEEDQKKAREEQIKAIRDAFENARAYWKAHQAEGKPGVPRHDQDVKWDAMGKALRGEIPVVFNAAALNQIEAVLKFADEQGLTNIVIADGYDAWRIAPELKRRNIAVIAGAPQSLPRRSYEPYDMGMSLPAKLHDAGVRFCISDGGESSNSRNLPYEAGYAAAYGLPHDEALRSITLYPAQIFGVADKVGSIEPGKMADLVVGTGDPLEITTQVEQVYVEGRAVSMENRQTRLFHKYDNRPRGPKARARAGQTTSMR
jgi:imidazolonepropionase-like amidohydrolase